MVVQNSVSAGFQGLLHACKTFSSRMNFPFVGTLTVHPTVSRGQLSTYVRST